MSALGSLVVKLALEYAEYTKGLDKSSQDALKFAQETQRHFDKANAVTHEFFSGVVKGAASAALAYVGVSSAVSALNESIENLASLDDMSQKTGASVENLSRLQKVAQMTGTEFNGVDDAIVKLAKGMGSIDDESNKTNLALAALNVSSRDAAGALRDPSAVLIDVAKGLQNYQDGASKVKLMNDLLGKSGADLLPYLNDVNENIEKFEGISTKAAEEASKLQDQLGHMKTRSKELATEMAVAFLPAVNDITSAMINSYKEGSKFQAVMMGFGGLGSLLFTDDYQSDEVKIRNLEEKLDEFRSTQAANAMGAGILTTYLFGDSEKVLDEKIKTVTAQIAAMKKSLDVVSKPSTKTESPVKKTREQEAAEEEDKRRIERQQREQETHSKQRAKFIDGLEKEAAMLSMTAVEAKVYEARQMGITGAQLKKVEALAKSIDAHKANEKAIADDFKLSQEHAAQNLEFANSLDRQTDALKSQVEAQQEANAKIGWSIETLAAFEAAQLQADAAKKESLATTMDMIDWSGKLGDAYRTQANELRALAGLKIDGAAAQSKTTDLTQANQLLDIMTELDNVTQKAAQGMAASFGKVGSAIGGLTTAFSGYSHAQAAISAKLADDNKKASGDPQKLAAAQISAAEQMARAQISSYGNMASAAKGFFKENSNGYKLMEGAEKAFRAAEMAMALDAMIKKTFLKEGEVAASLALNATKMSGEAASTGVSVGLAGTEASAWSITAVVKALASLPFPANLAAGAATLAAVVAVGAKVIGSFGGGGSGGGQTAAQRQKEQGTGSVFGDDSAKSDSIAKSIEEMSKSSNRLLPVNQGMLASLKNIESSMSGMTNLLVRTPGITNGTNLGIQTGTISKSTGASIVAGAGAGAAAGAYFGPIGAAIGALGGAIIGSLSSLWGKTTQNIVDSGVQFGGKLSELQAGRGFSQYASVDTTTSKWFGLQKSTSNSVQTQGLNAEMSNQMGMIFSNMAGALKEANKALGGSVDEITKTLDNLTLSTEKISLKGLTGAALTDAFNVVISKSLDEMAKAVFPAYDHFRAQGEGYAQTVLRVANTVAQVNDSLWSVGAQLLPLNELGINAAVGLAKLFDGVENLQSATSYFAENFLSDAERIAPIAERLHQRMAELGFGSVTTEAGFKNLVLSLDRTNSSQAALYVELLKLAPAFKTVADSAASTVNALDTAKQQVDEAKRNYQSALLAVGDALEGLAQKAVSAKLAEQSAQEKISEAYFNAQDAVAAAQKKIIDLTRQSADAMTAFSGNIRSFIASMSGTLGGQSYKTLRASLNATAEAAKAGDTKAQNQLTSVAQKALDALKENSPSASAYARESASIRNMLRSVADVVDARVRTLNLPPVADPMTVANKELLDAQARLLSVAQIAAVTGASVDRSMTLVAGSTAALLAEFQKAHADNVKAQADYATAQAMSAQFAIPNMDSLNGFLSLMSELSAAKSTIVKAEADLSAAIIKSAKATELSSEDFAKSLGLTGDSAALLSKAMTDAHLSTAGYRALMLSTGLSATGLAINLLQSGVAATDMAVILAKAGTDGEKFADRLLLAGVDVAQFAANIKQNGLKSDSLALIFDTSKSAADILASSLGLTSNAASNLAGWLATASFSSGEIEKKFASVGVSTEQLKTMLLGTGFSVSDFFRLLSIAGGSATSLHSLLDTSGLSGAGVNAASLLTTISGTTSTVASFADLLKLTGGDAATAAQLAANINHSQGSLQDFMAILSGAKTTANDFNDLLRITGVSSAAILAALGSGDKGLQSVAIAAGTSLGNFAATARAADLTMAGLDQLLAKNGLTASSFDGLKALTGSTTTELAGYLNLAAMSGKNLASLIDGSKSSVAAMTVALFGASGAGGLSGAANTLAAELLKQNVKAQSLIGSANESSLVAANLNEFGTSLGLAKSAADYVTQLLNSFKLPNMEGAGNAAAGVAKSLNQQLVEDWYKSNPNAIKTTDLQGIAYWVREIEKSGVIAAKTAFTHSVAKTSNTPVIPIDQFSQSFQVAPPPPAASGGGNALLEELRALRAEAAAMRVEIEGLREEQRIGDLAKVSASKGTTQALQEMSDGNNLRVKVVG